MSYTIPLQKIVLVREKSVRVPETMSSTWQASAVAKKLKRESAYYFRVNRDRCVLCLGLAEHIAKLAHFGNSPAPQKKDRQAS